mmetsp:Transcript_82365/g.156621  ORF Transcript_82365/g.156621 Transcript_82365/m.156621 type:complete len:266 (+) Transcript_82365:52-849(+)
MICLYDCMFVGVLHASMAALGWSVVASDSHHQQVLISASAATQPAFEEHAAGTTMMRRAEHGKQFGSDDTLDSAPQEALATTEDALKSISYDKSQVSFWNPLGVVMFTKSNNSALPYENHSSTGRNSSVNSTAIFQRKPSVVAGLIFGISLNIGLATAGILACLVAKSSANTKALQALQSTGAASSLGLNMQNSQDDTSHIAGAGTGEDLKSGSPVQFSGASGAWSSISSVQTDCGGTADEASTRATTEDEQSTDKPDQEEETSW